MKKLPKLVKFDRLEVIWEDAQVTDGGLNVAKYVAEYKACIRKTLGYYIGTKGNTILIAETDDRLAGNWDGADQDVERVNAIPWGMITELNVLN